MRTNTLIATQVHLQHEAKANIPNGKEVYITDKPFSTSVSPSIDTSTLYVKVLGTGFGEPSILGYSSSGLSLSCQISFRFNSSFRHFEAGNYIDSIMSSLTSQNVVDVQDTTEDNVEIIEKFEILTFKPLKVLTTLEQTSNGSHYGEIEFQFSLLVKDINDTEE